MSSSSSSSCSEIKNQAQKVIVTFVLQKKHYTYNAKQKDVTWQ